MSSGQWSSILLKQTGSRGRALDQPFGTCTSVISWASILRVSSSRWLCRRINTCWSQVLGDVNVASVLTLLSNKTFPWKQDVAISFDALFTWSVSHDACSQRRGWKAANEHVIPDGDEPAGFQSSRVSRCYLCWNTASVLKDECAEFCIYKLCVGNWKEFK